MPLDSDRSQFIGLSLIVAHSRLADSGKSVKKIVKPVGDHHNAVIGRASQANVRHFRQEAENTARFPTPRPVQSGGSSKKVDFWERPGLRKPHSIE